MSNTKFLTPILRATLRKTLAPTRMLSTAPTSPPGPATPGSAPSSTRARRPRAALGVFRDSGESYRIHSTNPGVAVGDADPVSKLRRADYVDPASSAVLRPDPVFREFAWHKAFWADNNTRYEQAREAYIQAWRDDHPGMEFDDSVHMAEFYKRWSEENYDHMVSYQKRWMSEALFSVIPSMRRALAQFLDKRRRRHSEAQ